MGQNPRPSIYLPWYTVRGRDGVSSPKVKTTAKHRINTRPLKKLIVLVTLAAGNFFSLPLNVLFSWPLCCHFFLGDLFLDSLYLRQDEEIGCASIVSRIISFQLLFFRSPSRLHSRIIFFVVTADISVRRVFPVALPPVRHFFFLVRVRFRVRVRFIAVGLNESKQIIKRYDREPLY
jgi:hypothetical protein